MSQINWIVFSRNRPYQLTAFLRSARLIGGIDLKSVAVIHRYDQHFLPGLLSVKDEIPEPLYVEQVSWIACLTQVMSLCGETLCFATDDSIFVRPCQWDRGEQVLLKNELVLAFCHRYGLHLNYCYVQDKPVSSPKGLLFEGVFFWYWPAVGNMWSFLGSVDAHQFRKIDALKWIGGSSSPNTLEDRLHSADKSSRPLGACLPMSCYLTIPANRVQEDHLNRTFGESAEVYYEKYKKGLRPAVERFMNYVNCSTHELIHL